MAASYVPVWCRSFLKSTVAQKKMGHVSKTMPLLGLICQLSGANAGRCHVAAAAAEARRLDVGPM